MAGAVRVARDRSLHFLPPERCRSCSASRTDGQTASRRTRTPSGTVTITLAVHPWFGQSVHVLRGYGRDAVWVERDDGELRIVPIAWTSLHPRAPWRRRDGREVRLAPAAAISLARWVSARRQPEAGS